MWSYSALQSSIAGLLPDGAHADCSVIKPPPELVSRQRPYFDEHPEYGPRTSLGFDAIDAFPSMIVIVLFTDVAVDYYIREGLVPRLAEHMRQTFGRTTCYYDGYRILRKEAAVYAGLGKIGRNGLFFSRRFGFNCKIDLVLTSVEFDQYTHVPVAPWKLAACTVCDACIPACPVSAYADFALHAPEACDTFITPQWGQPQLMCRNCITSCPPSGTILARLYKKGVPVEHRLDGVAPGSEEASADALYRRLPPAMRFDAVPDTLDPKSAILPLEMYSRDDGVAESKP